MLGLGSSSFIRVRVQVPFLVIKLKDTTLLKLISNNYILLNNMTEIIFF